MTPIPSVAWGSSQILLATAGRVLGVACTIASPGTYYVCLLDAATAPSSGDVTTTGNGTLRFCLPITTTVADQTVDIDLSGTGGQLSNAGIRMTTGAVVLLSSALPTAVAPVSAGLWCNGRLG
jgi:hypothetical protein